MSKTVAGFVFAACVGAYVWFLTTPVELSMPVFAVLGVMAIGGAGFYAAIELYFGTDDKR